MAFAPYARRWDEYKSSYADSQQMISREKCNLIESSAVVESKTDAGRSEQGREGRSNDAQEGEEE